MMRRAILFSTLALLAGLVVAAPTNQPSAEWIKRTKDRIDLLLGPKHDTSPQPTNLANPFRPPGRAEPEPSHHVDPTVPVPISDNEMLAKLVATLKINGVVHLAGVPQVIINQLSYKEGDLVAVRIGGQVTYLRVIRITAAGLTLELNKVEQTVRFK